MSESEGNNSEVQEPVEHERHGGNTMVVLILLLSFFAVFFIVLLMNYQKFQVRQTVARVRSDMRMMATAIESYYVDNMRFPAMSMDRDWILNGSRIPQAYPTPRTFRLKGTSGSSAITTPVAYLTSLPIDPFADVAGMSYLYYDDGRGWVLGSYGPDHDQVTGGDMQWHLGDFEINGDPGIESIYTSGIAQPSEKLMTGDSSAQGEGAYSYDPSNGVYSQGDLWRVRQ